MRRLIFTPLAKADIRAAYRWYEQQRPGLGIQFRTSLEAACSRIGRSPERFRVAVDGFRRVLLKRFPFEVFYEYDDDRVVVHFVFHTSQDSETWRTRLRHS
jgi:plasmid stabilization system protein ParE